MSSQTANVVMSSIKRAESAEASGALNTFQQLGNSVGVAILGTIFSVTLVYNLTIQVEQSTIAAEMKQECHRRAPKWSGDRIDRVC